MSDLTAQVLRASVHRFIGRMARDPELSFTNSGKRVCNARILINKPGAKRDDGQEPDGFKLEIWEDKAESFANATRKGDLVDVTGRVKSESWNDRTTGEQRTGLVVMVEEWALSAAAPRPPASAASACGLTPPSAQQAAPQPTWGGGSVSDEETPF